MKRILQVFTALVIFACAGPMASAQSSVNTPVMLLSAASTSGATMTWPGGPGVFAVSGTWNGATVTLEFKGPDGTMIAAGSATTLTSNGGGVFYLPRCTIQAVVSGAGGSTSLSATASILPTYID